jgi:hypothetical protein
VAGTRSESGEFGQFRYGYAGTIYKGQGRTLDQSYLYHSEHWRSASSYVALTRHRKDVSLFVATETARDLGQLARQMGRVDDCRAASQFYVDDGPVPVRPSYSTDRLEQLRQRFRPPANDHGSGPEPESEMARRLREAREVAAEARTFEAQARAQERDRGMER